MKRIYKLFLTITLLFLGVIGLVSCGEKTPSPQPTPTPEETPTTEVQEHEHPLGDKYSRDSASHWRECDECGELVGMALHVYGEWTLKDGECKQTSVCEICGFTKTKDSEHKYVNGKCSHCGAKEAVVAVGKPTKAEEPMTVYAKVPSDWTKVNCYYWCDLKVGVQGDGSEIEFEEQTGWPGIKMTLVNEEENIYGFIVPKYTNMIIFNDNGLKQTVDLELVSSNYYILNETAGAGGKFTVGGYETYVDESGLKLSQYPSKVVDNDYNLRTIYVQAPESWVKPSICFWETTFGTWPEYAELELVENNIYKYELPDIVTSIILSGGEGLDTEILILEDEKDFFIVNDKDNVTYGTYTITE